ncbi:hypothetical protein FA95DRAFT_1564525 [Auriscalpium vulgare]|uniref:Uncharacterized protein n=1 Tax=Auriscalpium vulgare TaxID=40419 RepID=A0ACB8RE03_9AGAM|nr:hypothetical protein FA95DRAFT_1564525 [Auriscalpium vulgare]
MNSPWAICTCTPPDAFVMLLDPATAPSPVDHERHLAHRGRCVPAYRVAPREGTATHASAPHHCASPSSVASPVPASPSRPPSKLLQTPPLPLSWSWRMSTSLVLSRLLESAPVGHAAELEA